MRLQSSSTVIELLFPRWRHAGHFRLSLPVAWRYRVSVRTGWPGVGILRLGEIAGLICNFCLSVAARAVV